MCPTPPHISSVRNLTGHSDAKPGRFRALFALFREWFLISLLVVGGGYAIIVAADDVFGRRLKWLREGELLERLPVFQSIPGLIAGNSAIYVGLRVAGFAGAAVSMLAVALPSFVIILAVARGYDCLPLKNELLQGAFLGLRGVLTGIILATIVTTWRRVMRGAWSWFALVAGLVAMECCGVAPASVLVTCMVAGIALEFLLPAAFGSARVAGESDDAVETGKPVVGAGDVRRLPLAALAAALCCAPMPGVFFTFAQFGLLCFGGGNVLVPIYVRTFVGPAAPLLQLTPDHFGNLLAVTQMTPGPISVNAATFFGYKLGGALGSFVATAGLLFPSFILLVLALRSLSKWRRSRIVRGLLLGVAPATMCLMCDAALVFGGMSALAGGVFRPVSAALAVFSTWAMARKKAGVMRLVVFGAAMGVACAAVGWRG